MEAVAGYRVVAMSRDGNRLILDESLKQDRAEQMRALLLKLNTYEDILVEPDIADQTLKLTSQDGDNSDSLPL
jgi:hypothetical protein